MPEYLRPTLYIFMMQEPRSLSTAQFYNINLDFLRLFSTYILAQVDFDGPTNVILKMRLHMLHVALVRYTECHFDKALPVVVCWLEQ